MKYKVLKSFLYDSSLKFKEGDVFVTDDTDYRKGSTDFLLLNGFIEEIKDEPWKPKHDDEYWVVSSDGAESISVWENHLIDECRYDFGNCFQTREQAEKAVAWLKAFKVLRGDTHGFNPDWKDQDQDKWYVAYDFEDEVLYTAYTVSLKSELIYFATEADAEESIKNHSDAWRIFLGVEGKA